MVTISHFARESHMTKLLLDISYSGSLCIGVGKILNRFISISSGPVVEHLPGVREDVGSIPGWVIPKTLKMYLVLPQKYSWFTHCRLYNMTGWDAISSACSIVFWCGIIISATGRQHHNMIEIKLKVMLNGKMQTLDNL